MKEKEFPPIHEHGFKDLSISELKNYFVIPFPESRVREKITREFINYLDEFNKLLINAEIWIDGSYATEELNPEDIDVVFFLDPGIIDNLELEKKNLFEKLFLNRQFIKNLYVADIFYADINNEKERSQWLNEFGYCYDNITPKGIFRIFITK